MKPFARLIVLVLLAGASCGVRAAVTCTMPAGASLNFGTYDDSLALDTDVSTTFSVSCCRSGGPKTQRTMMTVAIGVSANSGQINLRQMRNAVDGTLMSYQLYFGGFGATIWGDGVTGGSLYRQRVTVTQICAKPQAIAVSSAIFGRIFQQQAVTPGSYGDTLTITITP